MNVDLSLKVFKPLGRAFKRYHLTPFIVLVTVGLVASVYLLTTILNDAAVDDSYESPINAGTIDQQTLNRINALHTSDDPSPAPNPAAGRTTPFSE